MRRGGSISRWRRPHDLRWRCGTAASYRLLTGARDPAVWLISDFWEDQLVEHGRQYVFLVFVGFIGSFGFIRLSARLMRSPRVPWWPGSVVSQGGLHLHHPVWGIVAMMGASVRLGAPKLAGSGK